MKVKLKWLIDVLDESARDSAELQDTRNFPAYTPD